MKEKLDFSMYEMELSFHAENQVNTKGFGIKKVQDTFNNPEKVYPSKSHPGQYRITGNGLCLVGLPQYSSFLVITIYEDQVLTAPRPDQLDTPEGKRYAERYEKGLGRG